MNNKKIIIIILIYFMTLIGSLFAGDFSFDEFKADFMKNKNISEKEIDHYFDEIISTALKAGVSYEKLSFTEKNNLMDIDYIVVNGIKDNDKLKQHYIKKAESNNRTLELLLKCYRNFHPKKVESVEFITNMCNDVLYNKKDLSVSERTKYIESSVIPQLNKMKLIAWNDENDPFPKDYRVLSGYEKSLFYEVITAFAASAPCDYVEYERTTTRKARELTIRQKNKFFYYYYMSFPELPFVVFEGEVIDKIKDFEFSRCDKAFENKLQDTIRSRAVMSQNFHEIEIKDLIFSAYKGYYKKGDTLIFKTGSLNPGYNQTLGARQLFFGDPIGHDDVYNISATDFYTCAKFYHDFWKKGGE